MKFYISADMEGISDIANWDEMKRDRAEANALMTDDVNAVIAGILAARPEADEILVADSHSDGANIVYRDLDPRATLVRGTPRPTYMMAGLDGSFDRVFLVGYHAAIGEARGLMDHTYSSGVIHRIELAGRPVGEAEINAAYAAHFGVPVAFVSGDLDFCRHAESLGLGWETAVTKEWMGRFAAKLYPARRTRQELTERARLAAGRERDAFGRFDPGTPVRCRIDVTSSSRADMMAELPGVERLDGTRLAFEAPDMAAFMGLFLALIRIGWTVER